MNCSISRGVSSLNSSRMTGRLSFMLLLDEYGQAVSNIPLRRKVYKLMVGKKTGWPQTRSRWEEVADPPGEPVQGPEVVHGVMLSGAAFYTTLDPTQPMRGIGYLHGSTRQ